MNIDSSVEQSIVESTSSQKSYSESDFSIDDQFIDNILKDDSFEEQDIEKQVKELKNSITYETEDEISPEVYRKCLELDFAVMPVIRPLTDYQNNFNELESNRLTELLSALNIMKCPFGEVTAKAGNWEDAITAIADDFEVLIEKLVKTSKRLRFFNELCNDDQIALVKYGGLDVCSMRQVIGYDNQTQNLVLPGVISLN